MASYVQPFTIQNNVVTLYASDASAKWWPRDLQYADPDGSVNCRIPASTEAARMWKQKIGTFLVEESNLLPHAEGQRFTLKDFPPGYRLFVHLKGDRLNPRKDHYLCGSKYVGNFRSPAEFFYHAKWIMQDCPLDDEGFPICACKYCGEDVKQSEISKLWSNWNPHAKAGEGKREAEPVRTLQVRDYSGQGVGVGGAIWRS